MVTGVLVFGTMKTNGLDEGSGRERSSKEGQLLVMSQLAKGEVARR